MKTRSWLAVAVAGGVAAAGVAGSGASARSPQEADVIELSLLDNSINHPDGKNQASAAWLEETVIPAFEEQMAAAGTPVEVSFEGQGVDDEDYKSQLALDLGAGEGPDVFSIDGIWVGEFATAEFIAPLTDVVGPEVDEWDGWAQINEAVQANGSYDGARYGIPQGTDGRVIYFNKDLFEQAGLPADWQPATMEEVLEAARAIKEALPDVTPIQLNGGVAMGEATTMQGILPLLAAAGGQVYDQESGMWSGATPELIEALGTYAAIYGDEALGDAEMQLLQDGRDRSFEAFANGEIAMLLEGDYFCYFWRSVINPTAGNFPMETRDEAVGWAKIPAYEPGGALGGLDFASMSGGGAWVLNPNTEHPAEAWALMTFILSPDMMLARYTDSAQLTARDDVNAQILGNDPMLTYVAEEVLPVTHYRPSLAEYPEVSIALQEAVEAVVTGTSPEDAAADYQAALEGIVGADAVSAEGGGGGEGDGAATTAAAGTEAGAETTAATETTAGG
jgi:multiple sugar transport system substrate-binding protein